MDWIEELEKLIGGNKLSINHEVLSAYSADHTEDLSYLPEVVVFAESTEDVAKVLEFCNGREIAVTPRGAGTGLSGGSLPIQGGVSLSLERMNKILEIDEANFQATVEPGVINEVFQHAVKEKGLFYPPDPASKGSCFLGGNIAHSSGGPKALKYGTTKDYVLNLEIVLPNGQVMWTGANTLKNSTGYNLTQLIVGSEGTLAVVTKIVFKLIALPRLDMLMLASFENAIEACEAVAAIFKSGHQPSALELMERSAIDLVNTHNEHLSIKTDPLIDAYLLIEVDGDKTESLYSSCEGINDVLEQYGVKEVLFAESSDQKEQLWAVRRNISEAVKLHSVYKEEDTVVKRAELPTLLQGVKAIGQEYGFESICYGHAGDGNLHVNIIKGDMSNEQWNGQHLEEGIRKIFRLCKALGGTISGEHGIGLVQKKYLNEVMPITQIAILKSIKMAFDPKGILNPGKIFD